MLTSGLAYLGLGWVGLAWFGVGFVWCFKVGFVVFAVTIKIS